MPNCSYRTRFSSLAKSQPQSSVSRYYVVVVDGGQSRGLTHELQSQRQRRRRRRWVVIQEAMAAENGCACSCRGDASLLFLFPTYYVVVLRTVCRTVQTTTREIKLLLVAPSSSPHPTSFLRCGSWCHVCGRGEEGSQHLCPCYRAKPPISPVPITVRTTFLETCSRRLAACDGGWPRASSPASRTLHCPLASHANSSRELQLELPLVFARAQDGAVGLQQDEKNPFSRMGAWCSVPRTALPFSSFVYTEASPARLHTSLTSTCSMSISHVLSCLRPY